jgi:hypothetical protein
MTPGISILQEIRPTVTKDGNTAIVVWVAIQRQT